MIKTIFLWLIGLIRLPIATSLSAASTDRYPVADSDTWSCMPNSYMKRARIFQLIAFVICIFIFPCCLAVEPDTSAMAFVKKTGIGKNLSSLTYQYAPLTVTYQIVVGKVGVIGAQTLLLKEIAAASPKYQDRWDKNLADAYAETFSAIELESLAENPNDSPYLAKLKANQEKIGRHMYEKSVDLLTELLDEVLLSSALSSITPKQ